MASVTAAPLAGLKATANGRILFPPEIVDRAIATAPKSFTLYNREGQPHAELDRRRGRRPHASVHHQRGR